MKKLDYNCLQQEIRKCNKCTLAKDRMNVVPGMGNPQSDLVFLEEKPTREDVSMRELLVGEVRDFFKEMLTTIGLDLSKVYVTSLVKCFPPGKRSPNNVEKKQCARYLERQIKVVKPEIIVLLWKNVILDILKNRKGKLIKVSLKELFDTEKSVSYFAINDLREWLKNNELKNRIKADFIELWQLLVEKQSDLIG